MICNRCGTNNDDSVRFCVNCGEDLSAQASQQPYGYNQQPQYGYNQPPTQEPGKGFAIASMVLGIVSFFCFGLITGILAIIFGAVAKNKGCTNNMATAGIVCGVVGLSLYFLTLMCFGGAYMELLEELMYY